MTALAPVKSYRGSVPLIELAEMFHDEETGVK